ncbi:hypothetical protein BGX28_010218, partial [Mortierella sp. GBA30]
ALGPDVQTVTQADALVVKKKGILIEKLFYNTNAIQRIDGYHGKVSLLHETSRHTKFKLRNTICINGLQLHLLTHDTSTTRRKRAEISDEDDEDSDLFGAAGEIDAEFEMDDAFHEGDGDDDEKEEEREDDPWEGPSGAMESIEAEEEEEEPYSSSSKKRTYPEGSTSPPRQKRPRKSNLYERTLINAESLSVAHYCT